MLRHATGPHDVQHPYAPRLQRIGDQRAMAAPPHGLRAHQCGALFGRQYHELLERGGERRRLHIVGIASERGISPGRVGGVGAWPAPSTERSEPPILRARFEHSVPQRFLIVLRVASRSRETADVSDELDTIFRQQIKEDLDWTRGMTDRPDCQLILQMHCGRIIRHISHQTAHIAAPASTVRSVTDLRHTQHLARAAVGVATRVAAGACGANVVSGALCHSHLVARSPRRGRRTACARALRNHKSRSNYIHCSRPGF
jgi:hypothetical protein